jgi:hypothetical protein
MGSNNIITNLSPMNINMSSTKQTLNYASREVLTELSLTYLDIRGRIEFYAELLVM